MFALFYPPDEGPLLFKDHICVNHRVVSQEGDYLVHTNVVFEEEWSFIRGIKQCKPKHVSSGIVVFNVRWSLIRVVSQEGDYCTVTSQVHSARHHQRAGYSALPSV